MRDSKGYKVFMIIISLGAAGLNAYQVMSGNYSFFDVLLVIVFLVLAGIYINQLRKM